MGRKRRWKKLFVSVNGLNIFVSLVMREVDFMFETLEVGGSYEIIKAD